jgi:hypothetical protein
LIKRNSVDHVTLMGQDQRDPIACRPAGAGSAENSQPPIAATQAALRRQNGIDRAAEILETLLRLPAPAKIGEITETS